MSKHNSLKASGTVGGKRSVLKRFERVKRLKSRGEWKAGRTPIGLPNHPSYPSAHSCGTGAWVTVLADAFPSERPALAAYAQEASISRLYAGIHYRFDLEAGEAIGRAAGRLALERGGLE